MLTPEQKERRRRGIGGSEIAALAGLSKWASPIQIYEAKVSGVELQETLAMRLGSRMEDPLAEIYAEDNGRKVVRCDTWAHPDLPYALATPDRLVLTDAQALEAFQKLARPNGLAHREDVTLAERGLEIKATTWRMAKEWGEPLTDQVPEDYLAQVQWSMGVSGIPTWDVFVAFDRDRVETYRLTYRPDFFGALYEIGAKFMVDHVQARKPPPPDASDRYSEYLARAYPTEWKADDIAQADPEVEEMVLRYAKLTEVSKRVEHMLKLEKNRIRNAIGERAGVWSPRFGRLTWKKTKDSRRFQAAAAYQELRTLTALLIDRLPEGDQRAALAARLQGLEASHTVPVSGYRRFHSKWAAEALVATERIALTLDAVNPKDLEENDDAEAG